MSLDLIFRPSIDNQEDRAVPRNETIEHTQSQYKHCFYKRKWRREITPTFATVLVSRQISTPNPQQTYAHTHTHITSIPQWQIKI